MKARKELLSEAKIQGGLTDTLQHYKIFYMLPEVGIDGKLLYCSKISLEHNIIKNDVPIQRPSSIRLSNESQLKSLIFALIKAYVYKGRKDEIICPKNINFKLAEMHKFVEDCFRKDIEVKDKK